MIYHVLQKNCWEAALKQGYYAPVSLEKEGFIHHSTQEQVAGVLQRYYQGQTDLLLLHIDENRLLAPLVYELSPSINEVFPHLYGRLNLDAVVELADIP